MRRDLTNVIDTAALRGDERGMEKGIEKGREEKRIIIRNLKSLSLPIEMIIQATGLSGDKNLVTPLAED